jgi:hypothetical protein
MNNEEVLVTIEKDGTPRIEVRGVAGPSCRSLSAGIQDALGTTTKDTPTHEFHEHTTTEQRAANRR